MESIRFENFSNVKNPKETRDILFAMDDNEEMVAVPIVGWSSETIVENKKIQGVESTADFGEKFSYLHCDEKHLTEYSNKSKEGIRKLKIVFNELGRISPTKPLIDLACGSNYRGINLALSLSSNAYVGVDINPTAKRNFEFLTKYFEKIPECCKIVFNEDEPEPYKAYTESQSSLFKEYLNNNISEKDRTKFAELFNYYYRIPGGRESAHPSVRLKKLEQISEKFPDVHFVKDDILEFMRKLPDNLSANLCLSSIDTRYDENFKELIANFKRVLSKGSLLIFYGPIAGSFPEKDDSDLYPEFEKISEAGEVSISDIEEMYIYKKIK